MAAGFTSQAGFKREATIFSKIWPSVSPAVIDALIPLVSESVNVKLDQQSVVTRDSRSTPLSTKTIRTSLDGEIVVNAQYSGLEFFLTAALGFEAKRINGVLQPADLDSSIAFQHIIEIDKELASAGWLAGEGWIAATDGLIAGQRKVRRGTFAIIKGITTWESLSCMAQGLTIQASPSGITFQMDIVGYSLNLNSLVQTTLPSLICPTGRILFTDGSLSVREFGTGAFSPGDKINGLTGFSVRVENDLQAINTRDTGLNIDEPQRENAVVVTGSFAIPRLPGINLADLNNRGVAAQMLMEFIGGPIIGTSEFFTFRLWFPSVTFSGGQIDTRGPEQVQQNYSFIAGNTASTPTGFPDSIFGGPMTIELINTTSDHPLLD